MTPDKLLAPLLQAWRAANQRLGLLRLNGNARVDPERLGAGTPSSTTYLCGDEMWCAPGTGGLGDVVGPTGPITANAIVLFNGTTGKLIKDGVVTLSGTGSISTSGSVVLAGNNSGDQTITLTGDVTGSGTGSFAATVANDAITYAKLQNAAAGNVVLARAAATSGDFSEVAIAASQLLGRGSSGDVAAITLGTNLTMTGTTLDAAGGGSGSPGGSDTHVQINDAGVFYGEAGFSYNKTTNILTVPELVVTTDAATTGAMNVGTTLDVGSTAAINGQITTGNGTAGAPFIAPTADPDTGIYRVGANDLGIAAGGALVASFSTSGTALAGTGGTGHLLKQASSGGVITSAQLAIGDIPDSLITLAKLADMASDRLLGRDTGGSGGVEQIRVSNGLEWSGSGQIQRSALTGDVTASAGSNTTAIASGVIVNADVNASAAIALSKLATITTDRLLGRDTAATGAIEELAVGGGVEFTGGPGIQRSALTGDVTASAGSSSTTIANDAVTDSKLRNSTALSVIGRSANSTGDPADIAAGSDHQVLRRSGTALAFGAVNLASSAAVTGDLPYANLTPSSAASKLLGRQSGSAGDWQEITLGTNLSMSGTTLNASGGGGGTPGGSTTEVQWNNAGSFDGISELTYASGTPALEFGGLEACWQSTGFDTHPWLIVNAGGATKEIQLGSGTGAADVNLYRGGANILKTDDQFEAVGGVVLPTKSGSFGDGDFTLPVDGLVGVNTSTNKLEYRSGGSWYST